MTLRSVVNEGKRFSDGDTTGTYAEIKKALLWEMLQPGYISAKKPSAAAINTIIMVLWDGDWRKFDADMAFNVPHTLRTDNNDILAAPTSIPHYLEGEAPLKQRQRRGASACPGTDFLVTLRSNSLRPTLPANTTLHCRRVTPDDVLIRNHHNGRAIILQDTTKRISVAWHVTGWRFQRDNDPFDLPKSTKILGVATWTEPLKHDLATPSESARGRSKSRRGTSELTYPQATISFAIPASLGNRLSTVANRTGRKKKAIVESALLDFLAAAEQSLNSVPADDQLERIREDGSNRAATHEVRADIPQRLDDLRIALTTQRGRPVYRKELCLHALKRAIEE
jgi:predicted DNA-binding protein